jgi:predicted protein tyrosine phosphatase
MRKNEKMDTGSYMANQMDDLIQSGINRMNEINEKIQILPRYAIIDILQNDRIPPSGTVLISINDNDSPEIIALLDGEKNHRKSFDDVIVMEFSDLTIYEFNQIPPGQHEVILFTPELATQLAQFIVKNKDKNFMVHCAAGVSRSGAVGLAIACLNDIESEFTAIYKGQILPNQYVFNLTMKAIDNLSDGKND